MPKGIQQLARAYRSDLTVAARWLRKRKPSSGSIGSLAAALTILGSSLAPAPASAAVVWRGNAGAETPEEAVQVHIFFPSDITVNVGDSVSWTFPAAEPHTFTLAAPATTPNTEPERCNGATVTTGQCVWDGTNLVNSGRRQDGATYSVTFNTVGTFAFRCLLHSPMIGTVRVQAAGAAYPHDQAYYNFLTTLYSQDALGQGTSRAGQQAGEAAAGPANRSIVGSGSVSTDPPGNVQIPRFFGRQSQVVSPIRVGDTVTWTANDPSTPHTVTFGTQPANTRNPSANVTGGQATLSAPGSSVHSGFLGATQPFGTQFSVTFTGQGIYQYFCALHAGLEMVGTVVVLPPDASTSAVGGKGFAVTSLGNRRAGLAWTGGTAQASYTVDKLTPQGVSSFTVNGSATNATDVVPTGSSFACYRLTALSASGASLGVSDIGCLLPGVASPGGPPQIAIRTDQSNTATVSWGIVADVSGYQLLVLGPSRSQNTTAHAARDDTGGVLSCYGTFANPVSGPQVNSDIVCAIPGGSSFSSSTSATNNGTKPNTPGR